MIRNIVCTNSYQFKEFYEIIELHGNIKSSFYPYLLRFEGDFHPLETENDQRLAQLPSNIQSIVLRHSHLEKPKEEPYGHKMPWDSMGKDCTP